MYMCTSVPSSDVRLLVTVGVRYGSTVVAARARPKAIDCEVDLRRHRTLCVRILKYVPSSQRRCWSGVRKLICLSENRIFRPPQYNFIVASKRGAALC